MKEQRKMNRAAREKAILRYIDALERGDFDEVAAILSHAERDPALERMILEVNAELEAEMGFVGAPAYMAQTVTLSHRPNGRYTPNGKRPPDTLRSVPAARQGRWKLTAMTLLAAVLVVTLFGAIAIFMSTRGGKIQHGAGQGEGSTLETRETRELRETASHTFKPSPTHTSTPVPGAATPIPPTGVVPSITPTIPAPIITAGGTATPFPPTVPALSVSPTASPVLGGGGGGVGGIMPTATAFPIHGAVPVETGEVIAGEVTAESQAVYVYAVEESGLMVIRLQPQGFVPFVGIRRDRSDGREISGHSFLFGTLPHHEEIMADTLIMSVNEGQRVWMAISAPDAEGGSFSLMFDLVPYDTIDDLLPDKPLAAPLTGSYEVFRLLPGGLGEIMNIRVEDASIDTGMVITDPDGNFVASDTDGGPGYHPEINDLALMRSGPHYVFIVPQNPGEQGTFRIRTERLGIMPTPTVPFFISPGEDDLENYRPIVKGRAEYGALDEQNPQAHYQIDVPQGLTFVYAFSPDTQIEISHQVVYIGVDGQGGGGGGGGGRMYPMADPVLFVLHSPFDGALYLTLHSQGFGDYVLFAPEAKPLPEEAITGKLAQNVPVQVFSFDALSGQVIDLSVDGEVDTKMRLYDEWGVMLDDDSDGGSGHNPEIFNHMLQVDGTFYVVIEAESPALENFVGGTYTLSLNVR